MDAAADLIALQKAGHVDSCESLLEAAYDQLANYPADESQFDDIVPGGADAAMAAVVDMAPALLRASSARESTD